MDIIRRVSRFSGVNLLAYSVMSSHFHVYVHIGYPEKLDDVEIVRRIAALYSNARFEQVMKKWNELAKNPESAAFRDYRDSFLKRMWNASVFMQTLKQHYTMSFNARRDHHGTMWEPRYSVRVKNPGKSGMMMAVWQSSLTLLHADWPLIAGRWLLKTTHSTAPAGECVVLMRRSYIRVAVG